MIVDVGSLRITEAELASDISGVPAKVREGAEVIVEQDRWNHSPGKWHGSPPKWTPTRGGRAA